MDGRKFRATAQQCGSDYSGSTVERSNYREFLEEFGEQDGVHEVYGGHGTFAVAVRVDAIDDAGLGGWATPWVCIGERNVDPIAQRKRARIIRL